MSLEGVKLGHYRLTRFLKGGGMGAVYLAEDLVLPRQVAIKVMKSEGVLYPNAQTAQEAARLFQREMKVIAALDHPHILTLLEAGEQDISHERITYMVMSYCPSGSLADWMKQYHRSFLSPQEVALLLTQAAEALQHAHDQRVLHLDIKPQNFLVRRQPDPTTLLSLLLADFGVAKIATTTTMSGTPRGTCLYMAPEQLANHPVPASDQYALAIMIYELLVGRTPFEGVHPQAIAYQHAHVMPVPPSQSNSSLPPELDAVILRALAKRPEERFASVREFAQAFTRALKQWQATDQSTSVPSFQTLPLPLRPDMASWVLQPTLNGHGSTKKSRRSVVAFLAVGGLVAASTTILLNLSSLEQLLGLVSPSSPVQTNASSGSPVTHVNTPPMQPAQTPPTTHTGTVIGNTQQIANSAVPFTNPTSGYSDLLVRLASGAFVAYDRACTHVGVLVNYDPATQKFVCPAHGAIFDPANGGAVVRGPAQEPLPQIAVQVFSDGTVTTM